MKLTLKILEEIVILLIEKIIIAVIYLMIKPKKILEKVESTDTQSSKTKNRILREVQLEKNQK